MVDSLFFVAALVAVSSATLVVSRKNPVHSVLSLVVCLLSVAALFLLLSAQFLAVVQVIVYIGAIAVLFLSVSALLKMKTEVEAFHSSLVHRIAAVILAALLLVETLIIAVAGALWVNKEAWMTEAGLRFGTVQAVGRELFARYLLEFEIASVLLLVAIVGAFAIVKNLWGARDKVEAGVECHGSEQ